MFKNASQGQNVRPNKLMGQNFLANTALLERMTSTLAIKEGDKIIEVGPGTGNLTDYLINSMAGEILAIEKDKGLAIGLINKYKATAK